MADLIHKLLHAELSEPEWDELSRSAAESEAFAAKLAEQATAAYIGFGLAVPVMKGASTWAASAAATSKAGAWAAASTALKVTAVLALGSAATVTTLWVRQHSEPAPMAAQPLAPASTPRVPAQPKPDAPARPEAAGDLLSVQVQLEHSELVTVHVVDQGGRELRRLYNGVLKAGQWSFRWDGRLDNGQAAAKGSYEIRVDAGDGTQRKTVELR